MDTLPTVIRRLLAGRDDDKIGLLHLVAIDRHAGTDAVGLWLHKVAEPLKPVLPPGFARQFFDDAKEIGIGAALQEAACASDSPLLNQTLIESTLQFLEVIVPLWEENKQAIAESGDPGVQEILEALWQYSGFVIRAPTGGGGRVYPTQEADDLEQSNFKSNPLQIAPNPMHTQSIEAILRLSSKPVVMTRRYRDTATTAFEFIGSYWIGRFPIAASLPVKIAGDLDRLGINPLGSMAKEITSLLLTHHEQFEEDEGDRVRCVTCGAPLNPHDVTTVRSAFAYGDWVCADHSPERPAWDLS